MFLLQIPANINLNYNFGQMAQSNGMMGGNWQALGFVFLGIMALFGLAAIVFAVLTLMSIYHWGMTDKAVFDKASQNKEKWFKIFFIVPLIGGVVNIIPFLGQIASLIIWVYYLAMVLVYFFSIRKKVV
jgi:hypothetical protein